MPEDYELRFDDDTTRPSGELRRKGRRRLLIVMIGVGGLLFVLMAVGIAVVFSPTLVPRFRLVGRWVEVNAFADEFRSSGSEFLFSATGKCSKLSYVRGASSFRHVQHGRWSLEEVNGDEMTIHVTWHAEENGSNDTTLQVYHVKWLGPRRIEIWSDGSTANRTYKKK